MIKCPFCDANFVQKQELARHFLMAECEEYLRYCRGIDYAGVQRNFEETSCLWTMYLEACKVTGNREEAVEYIAESLTGEEYTELMGFAKWLKEKNCPIGYGNFYTRYLEYKKEVE